VEGRRQTRDNGPKEEDGQPKLQVFYGQERGKGRKKKR